MDGLNANNPSSIPNNSITSGIFGGVLNDKELMIVLIKSQQADSQTGLFYALHFNNPDPDVYSGIVSGFGTDAATSNNLTHQNTMGLLRSGILTVAPSGNTSVKTTLSFPATMAESAKEFTWNASLLPNNFFVLNRQALLGSIEGAWKGRLSYGVGFSDNYTIRIASNGDLSTSQPFNSDCLFNKSNISPSDSGLNIFYINIQISTSTQCNFKNEVLNGIAFVIASPISGKTERIQWIATTRDGKSLSFRADRP